LFVKSEVDLVKAGDDKFFRLITSFECGEGSKVANLLFFLCGVEGESVTPIVKVALGGEEAEDSLKSFIEAVGKVAAFVSVGLFFFLIDINI
jgi:hypothetical protein